MLTDGSAGMENQCRGLAEAMGLEPEIKRVAIRAPWRWLPPSLWLAPFAALDPAGDSLAPPWPDLLIATGRKTVALSIAIRRASGGRCFTVQIQNPTVPPDRFDLVVAPEHDGLNGDNVISTLGSVHRVTREALTRAAEAWRSRLPPLPHPLVAVLIGGSNSQLRLDEAGITRLADGLAKVAREEGAGLLVTPSRRTGVGNEALLRRLLADVPAAIWDGTGENPYFGYLGLCDAVVVTGDSVNMVTEALATGKPVHVFQLAGRSAKFDRFHDALRRRGLTRPFEGRLERWDYAPPDETRRVADEIKRRLAARDAAPQPGFGN